MKPTFTKPKRVLARYLLMSALALTVASCSESPIPPQDAAKALVYGMADSPIHEALKTKLVMTSWDGSQNPSDFDLVILDGDAFGVEQLKEEELIQGAIRSGMWILGLDLTEDKKQDGLGYLLGAGTPEKSMAYLVRLTQSPNGHPVSTYIDFRDVQVDAELQAQRIIEYIEGKGIGVQQLPPDIEPKDPPKGALTWEHYVTQPWDINLPRNNNPDKTGLPIQTASWTQSYHIRLFLESDDANPTGKSQWVAIEQQGEANPGALAVNSPGCNFCNDSSLEVAWPQTLFVPQAAISGNLFALVSSSPENLNDKETVTTTSSFSIGVNQAQGGFANYTYGTTEVRTISEWKLENDSTPAATNPTASWRFASANPYDGFNTLTGSLEDVSLDPGIFRLDYTLINSPNKLSMGNFGYATSSIWQLKGNTPSNETVFIGGVDTAWYLDAYKYKTCFFCDFIPTVERYTNQHPWGLNVNLGAVVPVPFKQGGFGIKQADGSIGSEITAGDEVTGVVTLDASANADAKVYLNVSAAGESVTIPTAFTTIKQGETTGTFTIQTAECPATNEGARLTAFYGGEQINKEITIVKPPNCS